MPQPRPSPAAAPRRATSPRAPKARTSSLVGPWPTSPSSTTLARRAAQAIPPGRQPTLTPMRMEHTTSMWQIWTATATSTSSRLHGLTALLLGTRTTARLTPHGRLRTSQPRPPVPIPYSSPTWTATETSTSSQEITTTTPSPGTRTTVPPTPPGRQPTSPPLPQASARFMSPTWTATATSTSSRHPSGTIPSPGTRTTVPPTPPGRQPTSPPLPMARIRLMSPTWTMTATSTSSRHPTLTTPSPGTRTTARPTPHGRRPTSARQLVALSLCMLQMWTATATPTSFQQRT